MNWWGNSFEKAVGFSNIATNALKKAQKKIDKVLDIPIDEDNINIQSNLCNNEKETKTDEIKTIISASNSLKINEEFSDIDLSSPKLQYESNEHISYEIEDNCERFGDWCTEDSLTASQFVNFAENVSDKNVTLFNNADIEITDSYNQVAPVLISNRISNVSISSDCTTSTIIKNISDIDSSGHTDDFTFTASEARLSDSVIDKVEVIEDDLMDTSFKRVSPEIFHEENKFNKDVIVNETKFNFQLHQPLNIICHSKDEDESNTTSSDIELLSNNTSNNGDNHLLNQNTSKYFPSENVKHCRSASGSSISICKNESGDYTNDNDGISNNLFDYQKQVNDLSRMLDIRESKIIQLSRENINLRDTINNLTRQIEQVSERQETDATDINSLTREFTNRLSEAEKRYQVANKERDQLKKQVAELEKTESQQIDKVIKEKEEQLASLLEEGEKLAQDQLKANNTIKLLRNSKKEKETENLVLNQKISKLEFEMNHLKKVLDNKEDNERKHIEGITQLTKVVEKMEKENLQLSTQNQVLQERNRSLETALDKTTHEVSALNKQILEVESEKSSVQKDYQNLFDQQSNRSDIISDIRSKAEQNEKEVSLLQKRIQMLSRDYNYKEEEYNSRISYLQERMAEMEQRNEELSESASIATRPVIRQLEAIQNSCAVETSNWEHIEKNLNSKIIDLQQKLSLSEEATTTFKEQLQSREIQSISLREEKNRIMSQYNEEYNARQLLLDEKMFLENKICQLHQDMKKENDSFNKRIKELEYNLIDIQHSFDLEKQNSTSLSVKLNSLQIIMNQRQNQDKRAERSRTSSETSTINEIEPDDSISMVSNRSLNSPDRRNNNISLYDSLRQQGVAVMMEYLEASLKQKEGQINKLQLELSNLRRSRESMVEEMSNLTSTIEVLESTVKNQQSDISSKADLNDRYNALLQMYGEKMEECEELRMDIFEVKEVYRSHIDMLSKSS